MTLGQFIKNNIFLCFLIGIILILILVNWQPGTWLTGWDTLHPEFNLALNYKRILTGVWRQEQGLGALAGHSHISELPRLIILSLTSLFFPAIYLRWFYIFLCLFLGPLGVYFFINKAVLEDSQNNINKMASFLGALVYLFNLSTLQQFIVPFEMFTTQFAFLGWLFLFSFLYLKNQRKRDLFIFLLLTFFSSPMAYAATLWYVYFLFLVLFTGGLTLLLRENKLVLARRSIVLIGATFVINSFWLLPNLYFIKNNGLQVSEAKINQLLSENAYLYTKKYGTLSNTMILKNYLFSWQVNNINMIYLLRPWFDHLRQPKILIFGYLVFTFVVIGIILSFYKKAKSVLALLPMFIISFVFIANDTLVLGYFNDFIRDKLMLVKEGLRFPFTKFSISLQFCYSVFFALAIYYLIQVISQKLAKFKIGLYLFTVFFAVGFYYYFLPAFQGELISSILKLKVPQSYFELFNWSKTQPETARIAVFPVDSFWGWENYNWGFQGAEFLYFGIKQPILVRDFDRWEKSNENFYWEISQAVYSQNQKQLEDILEKYQISILVLDKNIGGNADFKSLRISALENLFSRSSNISLVREFGQSEPGQASIKVYKVNLKTPVQDFVFLAQGLPQINSYSWNNDDTGFQDYGHYFHLGGGILKTPRENISNFNSTKKSAFADLVDLASLLNGWTDTLKHNIQSVKSIVKRELNLKNNEGLPRNETLRGVDSPGVEPGRLGVSIQPSEPAEPTPSLSYQVENDSVNIFYPFRSLFTGRKQEEREFQVEDRGDSFIFSNLLPSFSTSGVSVEFTPEVSLRLITSELDQDEAVFWTSDLQAIPLATPSVELIPLLERSTQDEPGKTAEIKVAIPKQKGYFSYDSQDDPNFFNLKSQSCDPFNIGSMNRELIGESDQQTLRFYSVSSSNCLSINLPHFIQKTGYLVKVQSRYLSGKSLLFTVLDETSKHRLIETNLPVQQSTSPFVSSIPTPVRLPAGKAGSPQDERGIDLQTSYFILPPQDPYGQGYTLVFDNISIGRQKTVNDLARIEIYPIPYRFLKGIKFISSDFQPSITNYSITQLLDVSHPNPSFYKINLNKPPRLAKPSSEVEDFPQTLILSQSYHSGWLAFYFEGMRPIFLKDHLLVNNWQNGWVLNNLTMKQFNNRIIYLFFLPQLLEYFGFLLLFLFLLKLAISGIKISNFYKTQR